LLEVSLPYDENGGNIENHEREGGDRQDGRRIILKISFFKIKKRPAYIIF
jgi:hypothetical protein